MGYIESCIKHRTLICRMFISWLASKFQKNNYINEGNEIAYTASEESYKCYCPNCNTEACGEDITIRYWKKGGCSHNGVDVYVCSECKHNFERRVSGPPYNYYGDMKKSEINIKIEKENL